MVVITSGRSQLVKQFLEILHTSRLVLHGSDPGCGSHHEQGHRTCADTTLNNTLLNLIGGLDKPDRGEVIVAGERLDTLSSGKLAKWRARHVGFVFQFYNLLPVLSAERNVEVPLLLTKLSGKQRKQNVRAALELVGLADRAKHKPAELSGGQQQRVAIARALVSDPTLLVCDEPTGDLDRESSEAVLELLELLNRDHGKTVIMVTHDPRAAEHASRLLYVDKGVLSAEPLGTAA